MRFFLLCLLFPFLLTAQSEDGYPDKYVWAKSGLTMRDAGNSSGKKLLIVPFGAAVTPTGISGTQTNVTALPSVSYKTQWGNSKSVPYIMHDSYIEVVYQGKTGFVYNGYLSAYSPSTGTESNTDFTAWMAQQFGAPKVISGEDLVIQDGRWQSVQLYPAGVMHTNVEYEGGGSMTFVFPVGSINDGYLIAAQFLGITAAVDEKEEHQEDLDFLPEILEIKEDGTLQFTGDMSETIIQVIGSMLIIHSSGGC
jgi:hypothetical protein